MTLNKISEYDIIKFLIIVQEIRPTYWYFYLLVEQRKFVICASSSNMLDLFDYPDTETWKFSKKNSFTCAAHSIYVSRYSGYIIAWWLKVNCLHLVDLQPRNI